MKRQRTSSFQQPLPPHRGYEPPYTGYDAAASPAPSHGYDPSYTGYDAAASTAPSSSSLYDNQV